MIRSISILILALVFAVTSMVPVSAIYEPADCDANGYRTRNNITMYDPCDNGTQPQCGPGSGELRGSENLEKIFNYFIDNGLNDIQAAGAVGNIDQESGGEPTIVQGGGKNEDPSSISVGWGIIQWTPGSKIIGIAKEAGITGPIHELKTQLDILMWHMKNTSPTGHKNMLKDYNFSAESQLLQAVDYFHDTVEGSADATMANRLAKAKNALRLYGGKTLGATPNPASVVTLPVAPATATLAVATASTTTTATTVALSNTTDCAGSVAGDAVATAINYSWPEYHNPPYTKMKDTYAAAVKKAQAEGRYVGGGQYPGVDCGGFVTTVMHDSGVDTEYGGGGNTLSQESHMANSGKYVKVNPNSTADLQPGDIAIHELHTYMYVGKVDGFETEIASASISYNGQGWRAPMAGKEMPADTSYRWYRLATATSL